MFDFDAGKLLIIGIIALIVIGPKELPAVLRQLGQMVARMRRMAAEFQSQFSEAMREAEVQDLQKDVEKVQDVVSGHLNPLNEISTQVQSTQHEISKSISQLVSTHDIAQDMLTMPDVAHMVEPEHAPAPAASVAPVDAPPQKPNAQV